MSKQAQYNILAAICLAIFAILAVLDKPDSQAMAALVMAGTIAGRGKPEVGE